MTTGASFTIEIEDHEIRDALDAILARMEDTRPFLKDDHEGAFRDGASTNNRVCREPVGTDRPGLVGARLQHAVVAPEDP